MPFFFVCFVSFVVKIRGFGGRSLSLGLAFGLTTIFCER